ncbi:MAG: hypothetical protein ABMA64_43195, partial [Myxococcota bacterium]
PGLGPGGPPPGPNPGDQPCPPIDSSIGKCGDDFRILRTALTCGGNGAMAVAVSPAPGTGTRVTATLADGSRLVGSLVAADPLCLLSDGTKADFSFGLTYTADLGEDQAPDGSVIPCVRQSKTVFSSFDFDLDLMDPWRPKFEEQMHLAFDSGIVNHVFGTQGGPPLAGRCAVWRILP